MIHGVNIDKDPSINKLQNDVFGRMAELIKPEPGEQQELPHNNVTHISPEEALKELLDMEQN
jgi:hypothetical protein